MRHPEPEIVTHYRAAIKTPMPKVCHTCESYGTDGLCIEFFMKPPEEFAATEDGCPKWEQEVPF
jgi:hypothetical protein